MHKEDVLHIYSGILAIKRHESESVLVRWMNLEPVIQSEVSQKEKNKYHILMHIYGLKKNATENEFFLTRPYFSFSL